MIIRNQATETLKASSLLPLYFIIFIMNCKFVTTLFFLVTAMTEPAFGQTDGSLAVAKDVSTVQFRMGRGDRHLTHFPQ